MALRIVKVNPVDAEKYAKEAIQAGVLEDKDILINKSYSNELRRMMDWLDSGIGSSIVAFMNGYNDPRRPLYFTTTSAIWSRRPPNRQARKTRTTRTYTTKATS